MRSFLTVVVLLFVLSACRPTQQQVQGSGLEITVSTENDPQLGLAVVTVLVERDGAPVSGAEVRVTGDMTHAGMAPVLRDTVERAPGVYRADDFEFTMAGDWFLTADIVLADGNRFSEIRPLSVRR